MSSEDDLRNFVVSTRAEVQYTGRENIEGFASLVNIFLCSMLTKSKTPCLINVDNVEGNRQDLQREDG